MSVQTFEALTDDNGIVKLNGAARLPAHTRVYVVVPEQTISYTDIFPVSSDFSASEIRIPLFRVVDEELAKRLVKTIIGDANADV